MKTSVLVTGGAGFIGSNLIAALNRRGEQNIIIVDHLGREDKWRNLADLEYEDLWDIADFRRRVREDDLPAFAVVFHLGACSATNEKDADYLFDNNFRATRELCAWALRHGARFIYASSAATYGAGEHGYDDNPAVVPLLRPLNMYGYSKHQFDIWALRHGFFDRIVGLKYFNVFGPYEDHKEDMRSVVAKSFFQIRDTGKVKLFKSYRPEYADGEQMRDFVYVKDAVALTLSFLAKGSPSGLFNCGTGQARTWKALVTAVFAAMNLAPNIEFIEMPEALRGKYQYFTQADMSKLHAAGYKRPFTSLEDAVADYIQNYYLKLED